MIAIVQALFLSFLVLSTSAVAEESKPIRLGVIIPLTGPLAFFGKDYIHAYNLAVEAEPDIKKRIEIFWEDSAYDSKYALSAFNKLADVDKIDIAYSFGAPMLSALAPLAEMRQLPFFATESQKSDCELREFCSLFRNEEDEWGKVAWMAFRSQGLKKIGIVKNQNQFMDTFVDAIVRTKGPDEHVEILIDAVPDTVDFRTQIIGMRSRTFDALGIFLLPHSHRGFLTALQTQKIYIPILGVEEFLDKELNKGLEQVIEGTLVIAPGSDDSYREKFERRYGHSGGFFYTPAFYDFLVLLKDTISRNTDIRGIELVKALRFKGPRNGVSGPYAVKQSTKGVYSYSFPIFVYKIEHGSLILQQKISL